MFGLESELGVHAAPFCGIYSRRSPFVRSLVRFVFPFFFVVKVSSLRVPQTSRRVVWQDEAILLF